MSGQINRGSVFGEIIYEYASNVKYKKFLEIGTWNGQGSTKCFIDGLLNRDDDYSFISIEASRNFYEIACYNNSEFLSEKIKIFHGRITEIDELIHSDITGYKKQWLDDDIANYNTCPNIFDEIKQQYDVVLLDGGEFSTFAEFTKLKDLTTILMLDDIKELKNTAVVNSLNSDGEWKIIIESDDRNGFAVYEKLHSNKQV